MITNLTDYDPAGFADGDRVRDTRTGHLGRVRFLNLTDEERASGECAVAEVVWDGLAVQDELDIAAPHLERAES